jgi:hypothetical protein
MLDPYQKPNLDLMEPLSCRQGQGVSGSDLRHALTYAYHFERSASAAFQ